MLELEKNNLHLNEEIYLPQVRTKFPKSPTATRDSLSEKIIFNETPDIPRRRKTNQFDDFADLPPPFVNELSPRRAKSAMGFNPRKSKEE